MGKTNSEAQLNAEELYHCEIFDQLSRVEEDVAELVDALDVMGVQYDELLEAAEKASRPSRRQIITDVKKCHMAQRDVFNDEARKKDVVDDDCVLNEGDLMVSPLSNGPGVTLISFDL